MANRRFPIQDEPAKVGGPRDGEEIYPAERDRRISQMKQEIGVSGAIRISEKYAWLPEADARTDAVAAVEWEFEGWVARWVIARRGSSLVARSLHLEAVGRETPSGGITADMLRSLSPSRAVAASSDPDLAPPIEEILMRWADRMRDKEGPQGRDEPPRQPGRPRVGDEELALVAMAYLDEARVGPGLHHRLADRFQISASTARDRISMCRDRGFLTPTKQGRRGAEPGPRLREWLAEQGITTMTREDDPR